ncbi:hypothetical protein RhiirB3_432882 [Rhizophagus irregularis]|nr:hypothetical protein RhiirB3_432882 [Rhizophagus irregularis]
MGDNCLITAIFKNGPLYYKERENQFKNNFANWTSRNKIIDNFVQEKNGCGSVFEWIPFNELIIIKEIEDSCSTTAILKNDITDEFLTEVKFYLINIYDLDSNNGYGGYGLFQNPDTKVYILGS